LNSIQASISHTQQLQILILRLNNNHIERSVISHLGEQVMSIQDSSTVNSSFSDR
jgi:hypothetical protein